MNLKNSQYVRLLGEEKIEGVALIRHFMYNDGQTEFFFYRKYYTDNREEFHFETLTDQMKYFALQKESKTIVS